MTYTGIAAGTPKAFCDDIKTVGVALQVVFVASCDQCAFMVLIFYLRIL